MSLHPEFSPQVILRPTSSYVLPRLLPRLLPSRLLELLIPRLTPFTSLGTLEPTVHFTPFDQTSLASFAIWCRCELCRQVKSRKMYNWSRSFQRQNGSGRRRTLGLPGNMRRAFEKLPVLTLDSDFTTFKEPITRVHNAFSLASSFDRIVDSVRVKVGTELMLVYWKKALEKPFGHKQGLRLIAQVEDAIDELAETFPPPKPKASDTRHQAFGEAFERHGPNCGVYHFARWVATGHRGVHDPVLSKDVLSGGAKHNAVFDFYCKIAPLIQVTSLLFEAVDVDMHLQYLLQYRLKAETTPLYGLTTSRRACFQGLALIRNLAAEPHKDKSDFKDGWVVMACFGNFTGGQLIIPHLELRIPFQPGDVVVFRSTLLEHYILPYEGERSSIVFFSHQDVMGNYEPE